MAWVVAKNAKTAACSERQMLAHLAWLPSTAQVGPEHLKYCGKPPHSPILLDPPGSSWPLPTATVAQSHLGVAMNKFQLPWGKQLHG